MAILDGSGRPVDLGAGISITVPGVLGQVDRSEPGTTRRLAKAAIPIPESLDAALRATGCATRHVVDLRMEPPRPATGTRRRVARRPITLDVPLAPEGSAQVALIVDADGVVSWQLPAAPAARQTSSRVAVRGQRFVIEPRFVAPRAGPKKGTRGIAVRVARLVVRVIVYPITDPVLGKVSETFAGMWERRNRPYGIRWMTPDNYSDAGAPGFKAEDWKRVSAGRALLLLHGTFSTAHASFGTLPSSIMTELAARYEGRVFAANMFTLSDDPVENARWILDRVPKGISLDLDIICHSRGGLVARELAERHASIAPDVKLNVGRVVFVGVPNGGTPLADPDHMVDMIDRFTNALVMAPTVGATEVGEAIVTAVKVIGHGALRSLSGLAAMRPDGSFLESLNQPGTLSGTTYYAIASDYKPPAGGGLAGLITRQVGHRVVDRVFDSEPNDLVVPTKGVFEGVDGPTFPIGVARRLVLPPERGVTHTRYFEATDTGAQLLAWLPRLAPPVSTGRQLIERYRGAHEDTVTMERSRKFRRGTVRVTRRAPIVDEGTSIRRTPSITSSPATAVRGKAFELTIDLLLTGRDPETVSKGVHVSGLPDDWASEPVDVVIESPALTFGRRGGRGQIFVRRNAASIPCTVRATVKPTTRADAEGNIAVTVTFTYNGRHSGSAYRLFPLVKTRASSRASKKPPPNPPDRPSPPRKNGGTARFDVTSPSPALTVEIHHVDDKKGDLLWHLHLGPRARGVPGVPPKLYGNTNVGDAERFVNQVYEQLVDLVPPEHVRRFEGIGELLYEHAPDCFKKTYWALVAALGSNFPIQFIVGEPFIPWELMRPIDENGTAAEVIALAHPVGRWLLDYEQAMTSRLPTGRIVTVAPDYSGRPDVNPLDTPELEAAWLVGKYRAFAVRPASKANVLSVLRDGHRGRVSVFHFAGHGEFRDGGGAQILLSDSDISVFDVRNKDVTLGVRYGTFVVFNACEVARAGMTLGRVGGWAETFLRQRFSGFVAPLWAVMDDKAPDVTEMLFTGALDEQRPLGEVIQSIRAELYEKSATYYAYIYYGDVMARFE